MRPVRFIQLDNFDYSYLSVTEDENRMVVRILTLLPKHSPVKKVNVNSQDVLTTADLLWKVVELDGAKYQVTGQGIFDKTSRLGKLWWKPNANIQFIVNPATFYTGRIEVISKREVSFDNGEKSPDWLKRQGFVGIAQVFCRSSSDRVDEASKSFTCNTIGRVYTNIESSRIKWVDSDYMKREDRSEFLILQHNLKVPQSMPVNSTSAAYFEIYKENTGTIAEECDGDYWYVDCTGGYIPQRKIKVEKGRGQFTISSLLMTPGDVIEVKLKDHTGFTCATNFINVVS